MRKESSERAIAYLDGADARAYKRLVSKLGSEDSAQNALILFGLLSKMNKLETKKSREETARIQKLFLKLVGISYEKFDSIIDEI